MNEWRMNGEGNGICGWFATGNNRFQHLLSTSWFERNYRPMYPRPFWITLARPGNAQVFFSDAHRSWTGPRVFMWDSSFLAPGSRMDARECFVFSDRFAKMSMWKKCSSQAVKWEIECPGHVTRGGKISRVPSVKSTAVTLTGQAVTIKLGITRSLCKIK